MDMNVALKLLKKKKKIKAFDVNGNQANVPLSFANESLGKYNHDHDIFLMKFTKTLRKYQVPVARKALRILENNSGVTLNLHTSFGKTVLATYIACKLRMMTIVVFTSVPLEKQWKKTITEMTNSSVLIIGSKCVSSKPPRFILSTVGKLKHIPSNLVDKIGTLIIDESHTFCTENRIKDVMRLHPSKIIACSATVERSDTMERAMNAIVGNKIIIRENPIKPTLYVYKTGIEFEKGPWESSLRKINNNRSRNSALVDLVSSNPSNKFLIMTWREKHGKLISSMLSEREIDNDWMIGSKKTYKDSRALVGTISKIGTGFDEKSFCDDFGGVSSDVLVMMSGTKSRSLSIQIAGRIMRSNDPTIVYFLDNSHITRNHFKSFMKSIGVKKYKILKQNMVL